MDEAQTIERMAAEGSNGKMPPTVFDAESNNLPVGFPELMTEPELVQFLRIPEVGKGEDFANVVKNLKRMRGLPCVHICRQPLYPREAIRKWIAEQTEKECGR